MHWSSNGFAHYLLLIIMLVLITAGGWWMWRNSLMDTNFLNSDSLKNKDNLIYDTKEECEESSGMSCFYQYCEEESNLKIVEICTEGFEKGWIPKDKNISIESKCEEMNSDWIQEYQECEVVFGNENNKLNKRICEYYDGEFDVCASACRHKDPSAYPDGILLCPQGCVNVCKF